MLNKSRADKGRTRKVSAEQLLEAIEKVKPKFRGKTVTKALIYRTCIEEGLLRREDVAPNTFSRIVREQELLKPDSEVQSKRRLAFSKAFANECWQADTLFGPYVTNGKAKTQVKLIAFIDDHIKATPNDNHTQTLAAAHHLLRQKQRSHTTHKSDQMTLGI